MDNEQTVGSYSSQHLKQHSDKGKWFGDGHTFIKCTKDSLIDCLEDLLRDRNKARMTADSFHQVTLGEFIENKLYDTK